MAEEAQAGVERLGRLFRDHPAWRQAARRLADDVGSNVYFSTRPGEVWHLERQGDETLLSTGPAPRPDFVFRFTPAAVERLERVRGGIGDFAVELFRLILAEDPDVRVDFRIVASFPRLVRGGYLALLGAGGLPVLAFGAARRVRTLAELRRLVERVRERRPYEWERTSPASSSAAMEPDSTTR